MQSGVLNKDNLSNVFRGLSQRRQQGTMEINLQDGVVKLLFVQGKIVEVIENDRKPSDEVAEILVAAERVPAGTVGTGEPYRDLFNRLTAEMAAPERLNEEIFKQAIRRRILDKLYGLQLGGGAYFSFKVEMVEHDRDLAPQISIGQLLLDYVALDTDGAQFGELFPPEYVVELGMGVSSSAGLSEEEAVIFELIKGEGRSVEDLTRFSLLSRYHIQEALLAMHKAGLIKVGETGAEVPMDGDLDASIDSIFEAETGMSAPVGAAAPAPEAPRAAPTAAVKAAAVEAKARPGISSMLLHSRWVPLGLVVVSLLSVVLLPMVWWRETFAFFMR